MEPSTRAIYRTSEGMAAHSIEGETILMPTLPGIGGDDGEFFRMNGTGHAVWAKLDGKRNLASIIDELATEFRTSTELVQPDVLKFISGLLDRQMINEEPS